jgi:hypothetical protein
VHVLFYLTTKPKMIVAVPDERNFNESRPSGRPIRITFLNDSGNKPAISGKNSKR